MNKRIDLQRAPSCPALERAVISPRPYRLWMSGSVAVAMAALVPLRNPPASFDETMGRSLRHSRFSVIETVQRIEATARLQGLTVLARTSGPRPVIVLASSAGGTLVVMNTADSLLDVPLSVQVHENQGGGADVWISAAPLQSGDEWRDLPAALTDDLAALPSLVDRALG